MTQRGSNSEIVQPIKRQSSRWLRILLAGVTLAGVALGQAGGKHGKDRKVSPDLDGAGTSALSQGLLNKVSQPDMVDVIVQFRHPVTKQHLHKVDHLGGSLAKMLSSINGGHFRLPLAAVQDLALDGEVAYISPNRKVRMSSLDHFRETVGADIANNNGWTGQGVTVAVIDSGISDHPDLYDRDGNSRVLYSESFVPTEGPADLYGHGTHVAGIIAGNGRSSRNDTDHVIGVSPDVYLVNLKVLDKNGSGTDAQTIAAIERAISLKGQYNIKVINLSQGRGVFESYSQDPLCQAVEAAYRAGIVVVVAAGNYGRNDNQGINGYGTITAPGNDPYVITVGAMNTRGTSTEGDDLVATYSSRGPTVMDFVVKPDLVAPGNQIESLSALNSTLFNAVPAAAVFTQTTNSYSYFKLSGTSMAAPVVAGAVSLMLQKNPNLSPDTIKARLMKTANKNFTPGYYWHDSTINANRYLQQDLFTVGAGYLNIPAALASTDVANSPAISPTAQLQSDGSMAIVASSALGSPSGVWNASAIWGNNTAIQGSSVVWTIDGSAIGSIDASSVIWTFDGSDQASNAVFGESVVWTIQSESVVWTLFGDGSDSGDPVTNPLTSLLGGLL
jgi:serine protease AprX